MYTQVLRLVIALPVAIIGFQVVTVAQARAEPTCRRMGAAVAPRDGESVPVDPTLYAFVPTWDVTHGLGDIRVAVEGVDAPFESSVVSASSTMTAFRVRVTTGTAQSVSLFVGDEVRATYAVDPGWSRPASAGRPVRVRSVHVATDYGVKEKRRWAWGDDHALMFAVSQAPAYVVEYAMSDIAYGAGDIHATAAPRHVDDYRAGPGCAPPDGDGLIGFGDVGHLERVKEVEPKPCPRGYYCCGGVMVAPARVPTETGWIGDPPRYVCVRGLYPDGSMSPRCSTPAYLERGRYLPRAAPTPSPMLRRAPDRWAMGAIAIRVVAGVAAMVGLLIGGGVARSWRRRQSPRRQALVDAVWAWRLPHLVYVAMVLGAAALSAFNLLAPFATTAEGMSFWLAAAVWWGVAGAALGLRPRRR